MTTSDILVNEYMVPLGVSVRDLATELGLPIGDIARVCNDDHPIGEDLAVSLASVFGQTPEYWLGL